MRKEWTAQEIEKATDLYFDQLGRYDLESVPNPEIAELEELGLLEEVRYNKIEEAQIQHFRQLEAHLSNVLIDIKEKVEAKIEAVLKFSSPFKWLNWVAHWELRDWSIFKSQYHQVTSIRIVHYRTPNDEPKKRSYQAEFGEKAVFPNAVSFVSRPYRPNPRRKQIRAWSLRNRKSKALWIARAYGMTEE